MLESGAMEFRVGKYCVRVSPFLIAAVVGGLMWVLIIWGVTRFL